MDNQLVFNKRGVTCNALADNKFSYVLVPNQPVIEGIFLEAIPLNYGVLMIMKANITEKVELRARIPIEVIKIIINNLDLVTLLRFRQVYKLMSDVCYEKYLSLKMFNYKKLPKNNEYLPIKYTDIKNIIFNHRRDSQMDSYYRKRIECYPNAQLFVMKNYFSSEPATIQNTISFFDQEESSDYDDLSDIDLFNELNPNYDESSDGFNSLAYTRH